MRFAKLGRSEIEVSQVCLGLWNISADATWGPQEERDSIGAIEAALDEGINFFDTAEAYGDGYSEEVLGKALGARRNEVVIGTKASPGHHGRDGLVCACEGSLERLKRDYIDLYMLHWPDRNVAFEETMDAMARLVDQGRVRLSGVSNFGAQDLCEILKSSRVESNQLAYNLLFRAVEFEILPVCIEHDVSLTCYSSLAQGLLTGKFACADDVPAGRARTRHFAGSRPQSRTEEGGAEKETFEAAGHVRRMADEVGVPTSQLALAWLLAQRGVTSVIAGARNAGQARANAAAAELDLSDEVVEELSRATSALKATLGPNPDMWERESRIR